MFRVISRSHRSGEISKSYRPYQSLFIGSSLCGGRVDSATLFPESRASFSVSFRGNATVGIPTIRNTGKDNSTLRFNVTEVGTRGILNVTIPRLAVPPASSVTVLVDGIRDSATSVQGDASNYYVSLVVPFGTHSVTLQFVAPQPPQPPYLEYIALGALLVGIVGSLFLAKDRGKRKLTGERAAQ